MHTERHTVRARLATFAATLGLLAGGGALTAVTAQAAPAPPAAAPTPTAAPAVDNGLARTPQMGFNNWNSTHCRAEFNEAMVKGIADTFVSQGLKDAGYTYVNIDDCWALPQRDASGNLVPDPVRFPNGIKAVADYVHSKGLKFGIYSSAGTKTCDVQGFPGGLGHEQQDAGLWASWGVDYLKYDNCNNTGADAQQRYTAMANALKATGRPILYSICEWGENQPWNWAAKTGNSWRTTGDISDNWSSMIGIAHRNQGLAPYAGPGAWNDPDMLEVGNGGMTDTEYRTHFSLWAQMAAPLLIGSDLRSASPATLAILKNTDVIAVDQDSLGKQGTVVSSSGGLVVMSKPLADGSRSVTLTNETTSARTVSTTVEAIGIGGASSYSLKDLWSKQTSTTTGTISASVPAHGTVMYRVTPGAPVPPPAGVNQLSELAWTSAINGWGPVERDRSNGEQATGDGRTLTIGGTTYAKGLGTHAASDITYHLGGTCRSLSVDVGVDDESTAGGSAVFRIYRDAALVADSGPRTASDPPTRLSADLTGGTKLRLVVTDGGDGIDYDHADWAGPKLTCGNGPAAGTHALSDLPWASAINGWGPVERDRSNAEQATGDGRTLTIGGTTYAKGLGTHAASSITYYLGGGCSTLTASVGIDDESGGANGSVVFQIYRDATKVADSGRLTGADAPRALTADLSGGLEVRLVVTDSGDGINYDHADWAAPTLTCT
ncbi:NPCBM/NEW2 domain-containing protein [Streptomyces lunaelactis]|uniref:NPCBM/NEW2 domain-containing protein n=4 Tax=Streptomyces lunaelactis TaxID=1535768 RepID=UPI0015854C50|nr:NPCBM/NEW2 domain-containing protein [Streptomyces lunaelactis]NUK08946.1 NPCBM/NEW2 domain-containing protein [Streptomyces lunaelactis]